MHGLSQRQATVLRLLLLGRSNREIAAELMVSPETVSDDLERIYSSLNVRGLRHATLEPGRDLRL